MDTLITIELECQLINCLINSCNLIWRFNTSQYAVLVHLLAQVTGLKLCLFTHLVNNEHIYQNQVEGMKIQLTRKNDAYNAPKLWINPEIKDLYDFTPDDIKLEGYEYHEGIKMEVSV